MALVCRPSSPTSTAATEALCRAESCGLAAGGAAACGPAATSSPTGNGDIDEAAESTGFCASGVSKVAHDRLAEKDSRLPFRHELAVAPGRIEPTEVAVLAGLGRPGLEQTYEQEKAARNPQDSPPPVSLHVLSFNRCGIIQQARARPGGPDPPPRSSSPRSWTSYSKGKLAQDEVKVVRNAYFYEPNQGLPVRLEGRR